MRLLEAPSEISKEHYLLRLECEDAESIKPGTFINIKIGKSLDPLIRRPFSIFDCNKNVVEVIFKLEGKGTNLLKECTKDSHIDILGPLGNGFTILENRKVLIVGGGVGNAPLHYLSRVLKKKGCDVTYIYGSRSKAYTYCRDKFCDTADRFIGTTDDGSEGEKGFVTEQAAKLLQDESFDQAYICGPTPMMKGMMDILEQTSIPAEISMENYFGCGIGVCSGCTIETTDGLRKACADGPVFEGRKIIWSDLLK